MSNSGEKMKDYLKLIGDYPNGPRNDVTPLFQDPKAFAQLINDLARKTNKMKYDLVAGIDALGFVLGAGIALKANKGFIPIRKAGKLPGKSYQARFKDYTGKTKGLEIRMGAVGKKRVLLVDDWIETGSQVRAAINLIERQGGQVVGIAAIHIDHNNKTDLLLKKYNCVHP